MNSSDSEIGLIGLAVMGQNLALNIADHGFPISVFNRTYSKTKAFLEENENTKNLSGFEEIGDFIDSLAKPRKIIIMVQAGSATDAVIETLLPLLDDGDIVIDGGNAKWTDTIDREKDYGKRISISSGPVSAVEKKEPALVLRSCPVARKKPGSKSSPFGRQSRQKWMHKAESRLKGRPWKTCPRGRALLSVHRNRRFRALCENGS